MKKLENMLFFGVFAIINMQRPNKFNAIVALISIILFGYYSLIKKYEKNE